MWSEIDLAEDPLNLRGFGVWALGFLDRLRKYETATVQTLKHELPVISLSALH